MARGGGGSTDRPDILFIFAEKIINFSDFTLLTEEEDEKEQLISPGQIKRIVRSLLTFYQFYALTSLKLPASQLYNCIFDLRIRIVVCLKLNK